MKSIFSFSFAIIAGYFLFNTFFNIEKVKSQFPNDWDNVRRLYPYYKFDADAIPQAIAKANEMKKEAVSLKKLGKVNLDVPWSFVGPTNIGGRVSDIEYNPLNSSIVYAGAATGGVFKSTDKGETWFPVFDDMAVLSIGDIGVNPSNPNIVFAGTGEANGGHNNLAGAGLYKSTDAGSTWQYSGLSKSYSIARILFNPDNTNIMYVAAVGSYFGPNDERGIYKSTDGGSTWERKLFVSDTTAAIDIVMNPQNPNHLLAAMWERRRAPQYSHIYGETSGIYKSTDAGETWTKISTGLPDPTIEPVGRIGLAAAPSNGNIVYASYSNGIEFSGVFKSTNFGSSWNKVDLENTASGGTATFSWYFGQIRVNPVKPQTVYVLDVGYMRSTNGGNSFDLIYQYGNMQNIHVDMHALAFDPTNPGRMLLGNDGGIYSSNDSGVTWSGTKKLPITQFYEMNWDYSNPTNYFGGTQDNGTMNNANGVVDRWVDVWGGDGFYSAVDYTNPNRYYAESQWGDLVFTTDKGLSWNWGTNGINSSEKTNWSTPVVMDPQNSNILYYGTDRVYRTIDGAESWTVISPSLVASQPSDRMGTVTTIAISELNSNYIIAGTDDSQVWVTTNGGTNWTNVNKNKLPNRWVTRVIFDTKDLNTFYVTYSGLKWYEAQSHIYKSTNLGSTFTDITNNLPDAPINAIAIDRNDNNNIFVGTDVGAFFSINGGANWLALGTQMPTVSVYDLKIHPLTNELIAATHGRSMYTLDLNKLLSIEDNNNVITSYSMNQNYPNPFNNQTTISFNVPAASEVSFEIYNSNGELVDKIASKIYQQGTHKVNYKTTGFSSGVYFYKMISSNFVETKKFVLLK